MMGLFIVVVKNSMANSWYGFCEGSLKKIQLGENAYGSECYMYLISA